MGMMTRQLFCHSFPPETASRPHPPPPSPDVSHADGVARYLGSFSCGSGKSEYGGGPSGEEESCRDSRFMLGSRRWWTGSGKGMCAGEDWRTSRSRRASGW